MMIDDTPVSTAGEAKSALDFAIDDGDVALEVMVAPSKASTNPFFAGDAPPDDVAEMHTIHAQLDDLVTSTYDATDIAIHPDFADLGFEDSHVADIDLSHAIG